MDNEAWKIVDLDKEAWKIDDSYPISTSAIRLQSEAFLKWDGCVSYSEYFNGASPLDENTDENCVDSIHICSLRELIESLTELRALGKQVFGPDWDE